MCTLSNTAGSYIYTGIRGIGFVTGPKVSNSAGKINHQMIHVSDWYPTLVNLAGGSLNGLQLDGYDVWRAIKYNEQSPRNVSNLLLFICM